MKWLKKWSYLILMFGTGIIYLSYGDNRQVYAKPMQQVLGWYEDIKEKYELPVLGNIQSSGEVPEPINPTEDPAENPEENPAKPPVTDDSAEDDSQKGEPGETAGDDNLPEDPVDPDLNGDAESAEPQGPVFVAVEDDYFADAVFIGDSRTVGMFEYGGLENISTFYASTGMSVHKLSTSKIVSVPGQKKKITVDEALQQNSFAKIYLMLGINEMGTGTVDTFMEKYREVVARIQELQPDAIIYLQGIMKVTAKRSAQGDYIHNEGIVARNEAIAQLADNEKIFYLDVNPLICDETGGMISDYTFDGVHLKAKYIEIWKQYLKENAIIP